MAADKSFIPPADVVKRIRYLRGQRLLLDSDLAALYGVPAKRLNEAVRRNKDRFPPDFCFSVTKLELKCIMQSALVAMMMHGYRPDTNRLGHHATLLQSLPLTIGADPKRVVVLDALRRQRNVADDTGDDIDESTTEHCINEAVRLIDEVRMRRRAMMRSS